MHAIKQIIKKTLRLNADYNVTPLKNIVHIGSKFHGYYLPGNLLDSTSVCYCIGAGEDISFDTELVVKFGSKVYIFDPMPEGLNHYNKVVEYTTKKQKVLTNDDDSGFEYRINAEQLQQTVFIPVGVWDKKDILRFYKPAKEDYASHSVVNLQKTNEYLEAPVDRLINIMKSNGHQEVDLVKMEIEGAEYKVIDTIVEDKLNIKVICVEFDEVHFSKGMAYLMRIKKATEKLMNAGYKLVHSTHMYKRTFVRADVFDRLKLLEQIN